MVEREKTEEELIKEAEEALYGDEDKDWTKEDEEDLQQSLEFLLGG